MNSRIEDSIDASKIKQILNSVHIGDARKLATELPDNCINTTITSPPYFDLKDYGRPNQIGFGQKYEEYLKDIGSIFSEVFRATVQDGSLWVIVDTFRKEQEVFPLPFDIAGKLKQSGWTLRDIIIWKKDRTVPWVATGATRKIFEYILVFSKGPNSFKYDSDKYRETVDLKKWWVRYPERYSPKGKAPEEIWTYDIPTQGSWGDSYIRHFCPLPSELVARIIQMTTQRGDVVLDPFAGSGTVPTISKILDRSYVGFELNAEYVAMFQRHLKKELASQALRNLDNKNSNSSLNFETTIISLRLLKYGRIILRRISERMIGEAVKVYVNPLTQTPTEKHKQYSAEYVIYLKTKKQQNEVKSLLAQICKTPPLSKFGIEPSFRFIQSPKEAGENMTSNRFFGYTKTNSHFHTGEFSLLESWHCKHQLFSTIDLRVEESNE